MSSLTIFPISSLPPVLNNGILNPQPLSCNIANFPGLASGNLTNAPLYPGFQYGLTNGSGTLGFLFNVPANAASPFNIATNTIVATNNAQFFNLFGLTRTIGSPDGSVVIWPTNNGDGTFSYGLQVTGGGGGTPLESGTNTYVDTVSGTNRVNVPFGIFDLFGAASTIGANDTNFTMTASNSLAAKIVASTNNLGNAAFNNTNTMKVLAATNADHATNLLDVTKPPYNAVGNGVANDMSAITNALGDSVRLGLAVYFPPRTYFVSPFTLYTGQSIAGNNGVRFLFTNTSSGVAITMDINSTNMNIFGVEIDGGNADTIPSISDGRTGLYVNNSFNKNINVSSVYVHGFGTGFGVYGSGSLVASPLNIYGLNARWNFRGLAVYGGQGAEYITFTGIKSVQNNVGIFLQGGNDMFSSCDFSRNNYGLQMYSNGTDNGQHGQFSACDFNHENAMAVQGTNVNYGEIFNACAFLPPLIYLTNCDNVLFGNCMIGYGSSTPTNIFAFDNCTNCNIVNYADPYTPQIVNEWIVNATNSSNIGGLNGTFSVLPSVLNPPTGNGGGITNDIRQSLITLTGNYVQPLSDLTMATTNLTYWVNTGYGTNDTLTFTNNAALTNYTITVMNAPTISSNANWIIITNYGNSFIDYANGNPTYYLSITNKYSGDPMILRQVTSTNWAMNTGYPRSKFDTNFTSDFNSQIVAATNSLATTASLQSSVANVVSNNSPTFSVDTVGGTVTAINGNYRTLQISNTALVTGITMVNTHSTGATNSLTMTQTGLMEFLNVLTGGFASFQANQITATNFITSGGTSSQFVKGDGSLDGSAYVTASVTNGLATTNYVLSNPINAVTDLGSYPISTNNFIGSYNSTNLVIGVGCFVSNNLFYATATCASGIELMADINTNNPTSNIISLQGFLNTFLTVGNTFTPVATWTVGSLAGGNLTVGRLADTGTLSVTGTLTASSNASIPTNQAPYYTSDNPTNAYALATLYTNFNQRSLLSGAFVLNSAVSGSANITLYYTNNAVGYVLQAQEGQGIAMADIMPFSVPLSTNATFQFVATLGSGATGYLTNVVNFRQ